MKQRQSIFVILSLIIVLGLVIEVTRLGLVVRMTGSNNTELLDPEAVAALALSTDGTIKGDYQYQIIFDPSDSNTEALCDNIDAVLSYLRKPHERVSTDALNVLPGRDTVLILALENWTALKPARGLKRFVEEGGRVFVAYRPGHSDVFYSLYRELGIAEFGDFADVTGFQLKEDVLVNGKGISVSDPKLMYNSSVRLTLDSDARLLATASDQTPLMWKKDIGEGRIVYFNGSVLGSKMNRSLIAGALSYLDDWFLYPIVNSRVSFIDDFPAPIPLGKNDLMQRDFNRSIPAFYQEVWWPDMMEIAHRTGMVYTGVIIGTYQNSVSVVTPDSEEISSKDLTYYGRELMRQGGEVGIHGFNHQPLISEPLQDPELPYRPWKSTDTMAASVREIVRYSSSVFPGYQFRVYVPPSNILQKEGRRALLAADADIRIIASVYASEADQDALEQELTLDPDGIIALPRFSSGYRKNDQNIWYALNGITLHGLSNHFVHPDDLLDPARSDNLSWTVLRKEFEELCEFVSDRYPWLEARTATGAANEVVKYSRLFPSIERETDGYHIRADISTGPLWFYLRSDQKIRLVEGLTATLIDSRTYLIRIDASESQIRFER